jgi:hypothetical protein
LLALSGAAALAAETGQTCRTSHNLVGACFTVHGHLLRSPSGVRLAWDETGRTLTVLDRQSGRGGGVIPAAVRALLPPDSSGSVEGDYFVCPFDRTHLDRMQAVCIDATSHLVAQHPK